MNIIIIYTVMKETKINVQQKTHIYEEMKESHTMIVVLQLYIIHLSGGNFCVCSIYCTYGITSLAKRL